MLQEYPLKPGRIVRPPCHTWKRIQDVKYTSGYSFSLTNIDLQNSSLRLALHQPTRILDNPKPPMSAGHKIGTEEDFELTDILTSQT